MAEQLQFGGELAALCAGAKEGVNSARFNGAMLSLAREAKGYSQKDLAGAAGCNQSRLSRVESGDLAPNEVDVQSFVRVLNQERNFFYHQHAATPASVSFYRKTQTLPLSMLRQCNAQMNVLRLQIERQLGGAKLGHLELPYMPPEQHGGVETVAQKLRQEWGLKRGPVYHLIALVEDSGCVVVDHSFPSSKLDGLSIRSPDKPPVIFLNKSLPKSRRRLSLAHELGHLIMHTNPHERVEEEAWAFAAEFLAPAGEIGQQLDGLNLDRLGKLKGEWGISMQALLHRAAKLGKISESYSRFLWIQIGKFGYRINEPFEDVIPEERPTELAKRLEINI